jgi:anti-anti-sigma regulatory factor
MAAGTTLVNGKMDEDLYDPDRNLSASMETEKGRAEMTDFMFERIGGVGMLDFAGDLTNERVEKLQHGLIVSLENADCVVVNLRRVTSLDEGCFQLLCSANRTFASRNKKLFLVGLRPHVFYQNGVSVPQRQGVACEECNATCLWTVSNIPVGSGS